MRLALVLLVGCGRIGFDPSASGDGGPGDGRLIDAPMFRFEAGECPPSYDFVSTSCYRAFQESPGLVWTAAEAACEADAIGAHLAVPSDLAEMTAIETYLVDQTIADAWIGISDRLIQGTYRAVTGGIALTVWDTGQPNGGTERCIEMGADGLMEDGECENPNDYLCEYDGVIADPSAF